MRADGASIWKEMRVNEKAREGILFGAGIFFVKKKNPQLLESYM